MASDVTSILKHAIKSRILVLSLSLFFRTLFDPYDTSASLNPPCLTSTATSSVQRHVLFPQIGSAIENGVVWDSVYFIRVAECGYEYEQSFAFLPLLPSLISLLSRTVFRPLAMAIGERATSAVAGYVVVNNVAFVIAAVYLYRLSAIILKDKESALRASILFCFNPASIFYSSIYTESLYALFSIGGLYYLITGAENVAVLWFALSGCARSNGVLNAGYFCFQTLHRVYDAAIIKKRAFLAVRVLLVGLFRCICVFVPFVAFQVFGYYNICHGKPSDEMSPWCKAKIPLLYNYIQSRYWGVGFLKYFQLKQLPNFLLASPILSLALFAIFHYVRSQPESFFTLGFKSSKGEKRSEGSLASPNTVLQQNVFSGEQEKINLRHRKKMMMKETTCDEVYYSVERQRDLHVLIVPCTLHLGFMAATAFFVMHVQVATRFLSASPPVYWFASYLLANPRKAKCWGYMIWAYSTAYILLGSLLFSNFYPFT